MRVDTAAAATPWGSTTVDSAAANIAADGSVVVQAAGRDHLAAVVEIFCRVFRLLLLLPALPPTIAALPREHDGAEPKKPSTLEGIESATSRALQLALSAVVLNKRTSIVWFLVRRLSARSPIDETAAAAVNAALADGDAALAAIRAGRSRTS